MIEFAFNQIIGQRAAQEDALDVMRLDASFSDASALSAINQSNDTQMPIGPSDAVGSSDGAVAVPMETGVVLVVADGMGGHVGGRIASTISVRSFLNAVRSSTAPWDTRLEAGLQSANAALRSETYRQPGLSGMGSTLVGAVIAEAGLGWISIGDSALYLYRAGALTRLNEDHSFGAYLDQQARDGLMSAEAAANDRRRNHLFYALLGDELDHFEGFSGFRGLSEGDVVVVASDGLKTLPDDRIAAIISARASSPVDHLVNDLLTAVETEERERQDNVSIIVARVGQSTSGAPIVAEVPESREAPTVNPAAPKRPSPKSEETVLAPPTSPVPKSSTQPEDIKSKRSLFARIWLALVAIVTTLVVALVAYGAAQFFKVGG